MTIILMTKMAAPFARTCDRVNVGLDHELNN